MKKYLLIFLLLSACAPSMLTYEQNKSIPVKSSIIVCLSDSSFDNTYTKVKNVLLDEGYTFKKEDQKSGTINTIKRYYGQRTVGRFDFNLKKEGNTVKCTIEPFYFDYQATIPRYYPAEYRKNGHASVVFSNALLLANKMDFKKITCE